MTLTVEALVVCDDIRKEVNGKDILIGVYGDGILVPSYPAHLNISLWILLRPNQLGTVDAELKVEVPSGNPPMHIGFGMDVQKIELTPIGVGSLPLRFEDDGELLISLRVGEGEWKRIGRRSIERMVPAPGNVRQ